MRIDVNAFLGAYPWRRVPGTSPSAVLAAMDRVGIDQAWVTHLPGLFWRDPVEGNGWLLEAASREPRFRPVPAVHPELAGWESVLSAARAAGAPAVRCDPTFFGISPAGTGMRALAGACAGPGCRSCSPCVSRTAVSGIPTTGLRSFPRRRCAPSSAVIPTCA